MTYSKDFLGNHLNFYNNLLRVVTRFTPNWNIYACIVTSVNSTIKLMVTWYKKFKYLPLNIMVCPNILYLAKALFLTSLELLIHSLSSRVLDKWETAEPQQIGWYSYSFHSVVPTTTSIILYLLSSFSNFSSCYSFYTRFHSPKKKILCYIGVVTQWQCLLFPQD